MFPGSAHRTNLLGKANHLDAADYPNLVLPSTNPSQSSTNTSTNACWEVGFEIRSAPVRHLTGTFPSSPPKGQLVHSMQHQHAT